MKKIVSLLAIVMMMSVFAACGNKPAENNKTQGASVQPSESAAASTTPAADELKGKLADIKKAGKLVVGTSADYPPYEYHKSIDGKDMIVGFDIEIAKAIASDLGVELELKDMGFDGLLAALVAGKVDMILSGMTPTPEREKNVDFSKIYYTAQQSIMIRSEDKDKYKTMADLNGKAIGVQKGSIQEEIAQKQIKDAKLKGLGKISDLVLELKNKKVDALVVERPVVEGYLTKNPDLMVADAKPETDDAGSAVAVKKDEPQLVAEVNKTLDRLMQDKAIDQFVREAVNLNEQQ